jgi:hypothetical protein
LRFNDGTPRDCFFALSTAMYLRKRALACGVIISHWTKRKSASRRCVQGRIDRIQNMLLVQVRQINRARRCAGPVIAPRLLRGHCEGINRWQLQVSTSDEPSKQIALIR